MMIYISVNFTPFKISFSTFVFAFIVIQPVYLLLINIWYILKKQLKHGVCLTNMILEVFFNVGYILFMHKIRTGEYIGDVPLGLYCVLVGIPILAILLGLIALWGYKLFYKRRG